MPLDGPSKGREVRVPALPVAPEGGCQERPDIRYGVRAHRTNGRRKLGGGRGGDHPSQG